MIYPLQRQLQVSCHKYFDHFLPYRIFTVSKCVYQEVRALLSSVDLADKKLLEKVDKDIIKHPLLEELNIRDFSALSSPKSLTDEKLLLIDR